jgi:hypothetical protein
MSRQVFPQAPSPTITSFRRISAMAVDYFGWRESGVGFGRLGWLNWNRERMADGGC